MVEQQYEYIFGFGSIINVNTHGPWLASKKPKSATDNVDATSEKNDDASQAKKSSSTRDDDSSSSLLGHMAVVKAAFGYYRGWTFRSATGFTALGVVKDEVRATDINGAVFRISKEDLVGFDRREVGYNRIEIPRDQFELQEVESVPKVANDGTPDGKLGFIIQPNEKVWVYVPQTAMIADLDHPILQSYVDTVLQGCLQWGGEHMCDQFVQTTLDWSPFFLNDTPSSRRPWLFRKDYTTIDRILSLYPSTYFANRRHPEEFASAYLIKLLRGSWSIPRRNQAFTGREQELLEVHERLTTTTIGAASSTTANHVSSTTAKLAIVGMGGVGKSQLCTEYCYRYFPSYYGLVIWLNAQSAENIVASFRQLMADTTPSGTHSSHIKDKPAEDVICEIKARLFRSTIPWLLVFDNLEDVRLLDKFVPGGSTSDTCMGHVLVTTRLTGNRSGIEVVQTTMMLSCLRPNESVELLIRSAGEHNIQTEDQRLSARRLADCLGHLPLALGMAAAYIRRPKKKICTLTLNF